MAALVPLVALCKRGARRGALPGRAPACSSLAECGKARQVVNFDVRHERVCPGDGRACNFEACWRGPCTDPAAIAPAKPYERTDLHSPDARIPMWLEAIITQEDLVQVLGEFLPVKIYLNQDDDEKGERKKDEPDRSLKLGKATSVKLVPEIGVLVTCPAELTWQIVGVSPTVQIDELKVLIRPEVVEKNKGEVLEFGLQVKEADFSLSPGVHRRDHRQGRQRCSRHQEACLELHRDADADSRPRYAVQKRSRRSRSRSTGERPRLAPTCSASCSRSSSASSARTEHLT